MLDEKKVVGREGGRPSAMDTGLKAAPAAMDCEGEEIRRREEEANREGPFGVYIQRPRHIDGKFIFDPPK